MVLPQSILNRSKKGVENSINNINTTFSSYRPEQLEFYGLPKSVSVESGEISAAPVYRKASPASEAALMEGLVTGQINGIPANPEEIYAEAEATYGPAFVQQLRFKMRSQEANRSQKIPQGGQQFEPFQPLNRLRGAQ